jgi:hypothetical protein
MGGKVGVLGSNYGYLGRKKEYNFAPMHTAFDLSLSLNL